MPGAKQAWPTVAACWSPAMPRIGIGAPRMAASVMPKSAAQSRTSGSIARGTRNSRSRSSSHAPVWMSSSSVRAGVGGVGGVHAAAGQPPEQEAVDGAEQQLAALRPRARAPAHVVEQPGDLGAGEIGVEQQAGLGGDVPARAPSAFSCCAGVGGAPVLPDDGAVDRLAGRAVPDDRGLALVGDADGGDVGRPRCRPWRPRRAAVASVVRQRSSGSCSTQPDCG